MGSELDFSIAIMMLVDYKSYGVYRRYYPFMNADEIIGKMSKLFDLNLYEIHVCKNHVGFYLKDEVFKENIESFLKEQRFGIDYFNNYQEEYDKIKELGIKELKEFLKDNYLNILSYKDTTHMKGLYFDDEVFMYVAGFRYLRNKDIVVKDFDAVLRYLHWLVQSSTKNVLKGSVYIDVDWMNDDD